MVVDQSYRLHKGVADRGSNELEATALEVFAHGVGLGRARGDLLQRPPFVDAGLASDKLPDVAVKGTEFFLDAKEGFGVFDRGGDFKPVANDSGIGKERLNFLGSILRDAARIEFVEGAAIILTLVEDRAPAQTRLRAFEDEKFEERAVVVNRHAPFFVVIANVPFAFRPGAADGLGRRGFPLRHFRSLSARSLAMSKEQAMLTLRRERNDLI